MFWWIYDNLDGLDRAWGESRIDWRLFCAKLAAQGVTDRNGNPPTRATAEKTLQRVRRLKARERAERDKRRHARGREPERGVDADRPPPVVTAPAPRPLVPSYPPPPRPPVQGQGAMHSRPSAPSDAGAGAHDAEAMLAALDVIIDRRSGRY